MCEYLLLFSSKSIIFLTDNEESIVITKLRKLLVIIHRIITHTTVQIHQPVVRLPLLVLAKFLSVLKL
jgi:hypothetical protein